MKSPAYKSLADAKAWRVAQLAGPRSSTAITVREASEQWLERAKKGRAFNRSGDRFKPKVLRDYESALRRYVFPSLGAMRLDKVQRGDVQHLADQIGLTKSPSTVRNAFMPLRTIFRDAMQRDWVTANPTTGIALPAVRASRDRIASQTEAAILIASLPQRDQGIWATAFFAGLRLGEIQALRWTDVDFQRGLLRVERSWDAKEGPVAPKSKAGTRTVPMIAPLRALLLPSAINHQNDSALVFGRDPTTAFSHNSVRDRATRIWKKQSLKPIGFHEARHTYASWMIAAGVDLKTISTHMGHSSIAITIDRYGHLMPGNEAVTASKLEAFLASPTPSPTPREAPEAETLVLEPIGGAS